MLLARYAKTLGLLLLLPVGWFLSLLPLLMVWPYVKLEILLPALVTWATLYLLPFPVLLRLIVSKVWFFKGTGEPAMQDVLEFMLMGLHDLPNPVAVRRKGNRICLSWRCDDPEWCQRMALARMRRTYELTVELDGSTRTATMRDRTRQVDLSLCPVRIRTSLLSSPRFFCHVRTGPEWGIDNFDQKSYEDYRFQPQELKTPVFNTILRNGWNVRFDLY